MPAVISPTAEWTIEPSVVVGVAVLGGAYLLGWARARRRRDGRPPSQHRPGYGRLTLFILGLASVWVALESPIDSLGEDLLLMHMVQHLLLLDIAPILLILGLNKVLLRPVIRRVHALERRAGFLAHPVFALACYVGFMWAWHVPAMYDLALNHSGVHVLEHLCFSVGGTLYWWHLLSPIRSRQRLTGLGPVAYMVSTRLLVGLLGVVLAFAPSSIYPFYTHQPHYWGLTPAEDQSMAGLVMALEQSIVMGIALAVVFVQMLTESERESQRRERLEVA